MIKQIGIKIILLLLVFAGLNCIYTYTFYPRDLENYTVEGTEIMQTQSETDIYYFGESSNLTFLPSDSIKTSIADLVNLFYPALKITTINQNATHAGIYKNWLSYIDPKGKKPKAIIVTLNLRSFGAPWIYSNLEPHLQQSLVFLRPYPNLVNRFSLSLQWLDSKTDLQRHEAILSSWRNTPLEFPFAFQYKTVYQWDKATAKTGLARAVSGADSSRTNLACHYIKAYAFNIKETNPRTRDFDEIAAWCAKNGVMLYLNLLAENIEYADSLVGKELVFLMRNNRDYLINRYSGNHCVVVDNLDKVPGKYFADQDWTTEHYNDKGRKIIARQVADSLKKKFNNNYIKAY